MKDFATKISTGIRAFTHYNRYKKSIMQKNDPLGAKVILDLFPLCIHINHPGLPGYVGDADCPCGVKCMEWPASTLKSLGSFFSTRITLSDIQGYVPRNREIEGLFTIGSVGSLGQTKESDYDIWVVVDRNAIGNKRILLLERKLKILQRWISSQYILDVHFFLMDVGDIQRNNFGMVSQEGSGSALKNILKEEFYRTLTLIEGRIPLWWITPSDNGDSYEKASRFLERSLMFEADDFIDLGDITFIPEQELLGAALWQMHKALDDPLKSVLKMALVATYLEPGNENRLLCEVIKKHVMGARRDDLIDPYLEVLLTVEKYYKSKGDMQTVELLRKCFYLKVSPNITTNDLIKVDAGDKITLLADTIRSWGWSIRYLKDLNGFNEWSVEKYRRFGDELHDYLKRTTVLLIRRAKSFLVNSLLDQDVEMEILRRRVEAFYVSKEGKIECEKRVKKKEPAYEELYFSYKNDQWQVTGTSPENFSGKPVMSASRVVRIIAWLVYNKRYDASTAFHMIPNTSLVVLSDIQSLLWDLNSLIPDANSVGLDRDSLMDKKYVKQVVIIGNMETPGVVQSIKEIDVLYINSWNELFSIHMKPGSLRSWMAKMRGAKTKISIWLPREGKSKHLVGTLNSLF
ncbi:MAG TPA: class I adenylate cyclase [Deltaproteobacteria bacterium]|nr:class I adenylate cyclase [Deltaproteobacteria bacterium]HPJ93461.1 class I adenylate cyclase [Deltaproteobacteria bacterium]HPR51826.1 class I adenylate cyclase [Deltaproteobacteria bacterium]